MNFVEIQFWGLLAAGLMLIGGLRWIGDRAFGRTPGGFDRAALLSLGVFLLAWVSLNTVIIFLTVAVGSYAALFWLVRQPRLGRRRFLLALIPLQLLPLVYYKYADFLFNDVLVLEVDSLRHMLIPVGISFYTFQIVGFIADTLAFRKPLPRFVDFMNFAGFFPQIVAGPIERRADLLPQMETFRFQWRAANINEGATWIALGLFFKLCLADNAALYFYGLSAVNPFLIWLDNLWFGLRIYYDFAGYSLVAVGLGRCLGIRLTLNFLSPYCATSMIEFWRRWHITLSQWFRDYVYVPMGGSRTPRWWVNVAMVFIVSGIWHGAGWNFIAWGALHGAFLIGNRLLGPRLRMPPFLAWSATFVAATFAWLCFYELRTEMMLTKMQSLLTPSAYSLGMLREAVAVRPTADGFVMACFLVLSGLVLTAEWLSIRKRDKPYELLRQPAVLMLLVVLTVLLTPGNNNAFIYFAF